MVNKVPTPPETRRRKPRRKGRRRMHAACDQSDSRNKGPNVKSADGDSEDITHEAMEPNKLAAKIIQQKDIQESLKGVTEGKLRPFLVFTTNVCAISKFLLTRAPDLVLQVEEYLENHTGSRSGNGLLTFILEGPHADMIPQNNPPSIWDIEDSAGPTNEPDPSKHQLAASTSASGTQMAQQQPAAGIYPEDAQGQPSHPHHHLQAPQGAQVAPAGTVQPAALAGSAPAQHHTGQQSPVGQASSVRPPQNQGGAGTNFASFDQQGLPSNGAVSFPSGPNPAPYGQQLPLVPTTTAAAVSAGQNPSHTAQSGSGLQAGQRGTVQQFYAPTALPGSHTSHAMNPGVQSGMAQPLRTHPIHQPQPQPQHSPLNLTTIQPQAPAVHPMSTQLQAGQMTGQTAGQGWAVNGVSQLPSQVAQVQPTAFPHGQQWTANPAAFPQVLNQVAAAAQQGNATLPAQSLPQTQGAYGQPGQVNIFAQPPAAPPQSEAMPNVSWPGPMQEGNVSGNESDHQFLAAFSDLPSVF